MHRCDHLLVQRALVKKYGAEKALILELFIQTQIVYSDNKRYKFQNQYWFPYKQKLLAERMCMSKFRISSLIRNLIDDGVVLKRQRIIAKKINLYTVVKENL